MKLIKNKFQYIYLLLIFGISCGPRVEMDLTKYGDTAFLLDARLFYLEQGERQVWEGDGTLTGARRVFFSQGAATIDNENFIATISVSSNDATLLSQSGIVFTHRAMKIEPLGETPRAGVPADFTEGSFVYRVYSADGTTHDWTIYINIT